LPLLLIPGLLAAADPLTGNWSVDPARVSQRPVGLRIQSLRIVAEGNRLAMEESGELPGGGAYTFALTADCDGRINGVADQPQVDAVQCWRGDPRGFLLKLIRGAAPIEWRTAEVAKNGQSLRVTTTVSDEKGKEEKTTALFVKK
jgi:hypothetical protein